MVQVVNSLDKYVLIETESEKLKPSIILEMVLDGTGIPSVEPISQYYCSWTWDYSFVYDALWEKHSDLILKRLSDFCGSKEVVHFEISH